MITRQQRKWLKEGIAKLKKAIATNPHNYELAKPAALEIAQKMTREGKVILAPEVAAVNTPDQRTAIMANWLMMKTFKEERKC